MKSAFTLTELLVVITIVAILGSVALPTAQMVRNAAQATACASNQRQLAVAALAYAEDNEALLPADTYLATTKNGVRDKDASSPAWFYRLPEYLDAKDTGADRNVFQCPMWRTVAGLTAVLAKDLPRSLKQNDYLDYRDGDWKNGQFRHYRLGSVPDQDELMLFGDGYASTTGQGQWGHLQEGWVDFERHRKQMVGTTISGRSQKSRSAKEFTWSSRLWTLP